MCVSTSATVDTGASITVFNPRLYESIPPHKKPPLNPTNIYLQTATGADVPIAGVVNLVIQMEAMQFIQGVVIASIHNNALLGSDFLSASEAIIHCRQQEFDIHGRRIPPGPASSLYDMCAVISSTATVDPG
jgi:hypothetical protein